ncbi:MAG TPA: homoserine kinase [Actinomycetota bacterium]
MRLTARVPASSANLGPGFDSFGLALDLCNEVTVDTEAEPTVRWEGEGAGELPTDGSDMVSRAIAAAVERRRGHHPDASVPPFAIRGLNRIPLERGLGSSSAAAVAGTALASALLGAAGWDDPHTTFAYAAELEGHPDNAAPAAYGGLTVVADGHVRRFEVSDAISPVALVPTDRLLTAAARRALPRTVPMEDAVFNVAHGALLLQALVSGDRDLLRLALRDRLHQAVRLALVPEVERVFARLEGSVPVCVSGAGPSLLAFPADGGSIPDLGRGWRVVPVPVRATGVEISAE